MSGLRQIVQRVAVRSVSAELDRRSARLEQAQNDTRALVDQQRVEVASQMDALRTELRAELRGVETIRASLQTAIDRLASRVDALSTRLNANDDDSRAHGDEITQLRFDIEVAQRSLGELTSVLERLTTPG